MRLVPLRQVVRFIRGITFKPADKVLPHSRDSVVCMRTKNIQADLDESDLISVPARLIRTEELLLRSGDILISSANSWNLVGKCCYVNGLQYPATAGGFIAVVRATETSVDSRYLYYWLSSSEVQSRIRSLGRQTTNIANLDVDRFLSLPFPLVSPQEQRRIVSMLDKADAIRRKREQVIQRADEFLRAIFLDMFGDPVRNPKGWPQRTFGDEVALMQYGPRFYNQPYVADGMRIVRITDLSKNGDLSFDEMPRISSTPEQERAYTLQPGDIIFARSGATVGKTAVVKPGNPPCIAGAYFIRLRMSSAVTPQYARAVLAMPSIQDIIVGQSRQSAQQNFSGPGLRRLPLPLPPIDFQDRFRAVEDKVACFVRKLAEHNEFVTKLSDALVSRTFGIKA